ncbi:MAG: flagellar basal body L-ring protein FlgH [Deltaproteobacteria bacterium]|nr:flagellar basal body L-ring protein FlgH [Deltaproteobacteria bacterium]
MFNKSKCSLNLLCYSLALFSVIINLTGCASGLKKSEAVRGDMINDVTEERQIKYEGSLWQDSGPLTDLFSNPKAGKIGDILTVTVIESSSAINNADTKTGRKSSVTARLENLLGMEGRYPTTAHPYFNPFSSIKGGMESDFNGSGTTKRSGKLDASLTVTVKDVLPNGNLKILGSREITVNNEKQFITLSGIVRPRDISPDNVILSTYISDAKIEYSGSGIINERQRPGWAARILNVIWPF